MWKLFSKMGATAKAVAAGQAQQKLGLQSPQLPSSLVRIGRFLYVATVGWVGVCYYTGYVNARTTPGSGPTLLIPGTGGPATQSVSRPDPTGNGGSGNSGPGSVAGTAASLAGKAGAYKADYPSLVERTDQGVDFAGAPGNNAVRALQDGVVTKVGIWPGWPGGDGIVYKAKGVQYPIYVMESFKRAVNPSTGKPWQAGDIVRKGQLLGTVVYPGTGIETGYTNSQMTGPLTPYNGANDGTPMPGGLAFRKLLGYN